MKRILIGMMILVPFTIITTINLNSEETTNSIQNEKFLLKEDEKFILNKIIVDISKKLRKYEVFVKANKDIKFNSSGVIVIPTTLDKNNEEDIMLAYEIKRVVESYLQEHDDLLFQIDVIIQSNTGEDFLSLRNSKIAFENGLTPLPDGGTNFLEPEPLPKIPPPIPDPMSHSEDKQ